MSDAINEVICMHAIIDNTNPFGYSGGFEEIRIRIKPKWQLDNRESKTTDVILYYWILDELI